jgi:hypothetical protein
MAWTRLATRLESESIPLVIAGPMLRKVTDSSVTVWLALQKKAEVTLDVYSTDAQVASSLLSGKRKTVRVGRNLHIVAVTAERGNKPALTPGTVYYYDLSFATDSGSKDLATAVGASGKAAYAYGTRRLPGFALPPADLEEVRLIQGSCRKPNAEGPDALARLDDMIEAAEASPRGRPHQLLLTGDQIYADEVADVLLLMLTDAASALMVDPEPVPGGPGGSESLAEMLPPTTRTETILQDARFTTVDHRSHLMSFGEYMAMYLFVWSDVLWSPTIPDFSDLAIALQGRKDALVKLASLTPDISEQRRNVVQFHSTIKKVRRALANVPTAMIFDDHEITDDWNMTRDFCNKVYGSERGFRIILNGLAAYALCQHWGNAPEQFETNPRPNSFNPAGVELLHLFDAASKYADIVDGEFFKRALGLHTPDKLAVQVPEYMVFHDVGARELIGDRWIDSQSLIYHYTLEAKAYQVIATDSRTWRSFPLRGGTSPPDLIAKAQLSFQIGQTPKLNDRMLMIVMTTNMPPGPTIRQGERDLAVLVKLDGVKHWYDDFYDSWNFRSVATARVLAEITRKFPKNAQGAHAGSVVLLSGDVHTSSASRITYSAPTAQVGDPAGAPTRAELSIAQLIGSALHNQAEKTKGQHEQGYPYVPEGVAEYLRQKVLLTEGFVGWNPVTTPKGVDTVLVDYHDKFVKGGKMPYIFVPETPTVTLRDEELPIRPVDAPLVDETIWTKKFLKVLRLPVDYRIRLDYLKIIDSGSFNRQPRVIEPSNDRFKVHSEKARAYEDYVSSAKRGREIVGLNNIGEIEFIRHPDSFVSPKLMVRYTVIWFEKGTNQFVRWDISLDVLDKAYPQLDFPT